MQNIVSNVLARAKRFTVLDWALLKVMLLSLGALMGATFHRVFRRFAMLLGIIALFSYTLLLLRMCAEPHKQHGCCCKF